MNLTTAEVDEAKLETGRQLVEGQYVRWLRVEGRSAVETWGELVAVLRCRAAGSGIVKNV